MTVLVIIAAVLLGSAAVAMATRNLIHSVLLLVVAWLGITAFYLWSGAEFVAFAQALVYVGAVSMIVLFAVLLTRASTAPAPLDVVLLSRGISAFLAAAMVAAVVAAAVVNTRFILPRRPPPQFSVRDIGQQMLGPYAPALLIVGVVLTVALIGAIIIAAPEKESTDDNR